MEYEPGSAAPGFNAPSAHLGPDMTARPFHDDVLLNMQPSPRWPSAEAVAVSGTVSDSLHEEHRTMSGG
ncbi:hypothetical protein NDU88_003447 [Pleurodeles waltl]|uniref:Uncharacterized protein n=1 Tax=Pleurodeles waltl TaxID=8319 RepID=A0AAV7UYH2_PLEWA|nr:hypothetical protein NDU88_003447 [Pleurodeles waltl]